MLRILNGFFINLTSKIFMIVTLRNIFVFGTFMFSRFNNFDFIRNWFQISPYYCDIKKILLWREFKLTQPPDMPLTYCLILLTHP